MYAVDELKDVTAVTEYHMKLNNSFQEMQQSTDTEQQWTLLKQTVTKHAEVMIRQRWGT